MFFYYFEMCNHGMTNTFQFAKKNNAENVKLKIELTIEPNKILRPNYFQQKQ